MLVDANFQTWLLIGWKGTCSWTETMIWNLFNQDGWLGYEGALKITYRKVTCKVYHQWRTNFLRWWLDTMNFSHFLSFVVHKLCANQIFLSKSTNKLGNKVKQKRYRVGRTNKSVSCMVKNFIFLQNISAEKCQNIFMSLCRDQSVYEFSQWMTLLHCNII